MNEYSEYYYEIIEKYKLFHKQELKINPGFSTFLGYSLSKWIVDIKDIIKSSNCILYWILVVAKVFYTKINSKFRGKRI